MAAGRSFADYVKRKCYNGLFSDAEDYIREKGLVSISLDANGEPEDFRTEILKEELDENGVLIENAQVE